jgi:peptidoglycan/LPS O-acetylase OafA/YrhL
MRNRFDQRESCLGIKIVDKTECDGQFKLGNRPELDGIRGLSVLAVMAWHVAIPFVRAGNIGVDVFFVLSGFLITTLLLQEWEKSGTIGLKNFYIRRALRLFPVLFVVMLLYGIYAAFFEKPDEALRSYKYIAATLLYVANWVQVIFGLHHPVLGHTWSLAVEEQFYILYPLLLLGFLRTKLNQRWLLVIFAVVIVGVFLNRFWIWQGEISYDRAHMSLDTRADALLIGCFVSVLVVNRLIPTTFWALVAIRILSFASTVLLCSLIVGGVSDEVYYKYGVASLTPICVGFVIIDLMGKPLRLTQWFLQNAALVWVGRLSYGLYLWHIPVFFMIGTHNTWSGIQVQGLRFLSVFLVAAASFYLIEQPFLRLKSRFSIREIPDEKLTGFVQVPQTAS